MSNQIREPFCPLYREARQVAPWKSALSAHAGLCFDKFGDAWRRDPKWIYAFDKGNRTKHEGAKQPDEKENYWLQQLFPNRYKPDSKLLAEACDRQRRLIEHLGGKLLPLTNTDRFVTGMGREHPLENGFVWHHTLGVPYLPGSSLKGMLRAWLRETEGEIAKDKHGNEVFRESAQLLQWFGTNAAAGRLLLFDMLPLEPPQLSVDVMTPHYGPYYQDETGNIVPGDWHSPVPITFLSVAPGQSWQVGIAPADRQGKVSEVDFNKLESALIEGLEVAGAGAKTAVGYGRFVIDNEVKLRLDREAEQRRRAAEVAIRLTAQQAAFQASMSNDSEPLRGLKQAQRDANWQRSAGDNAMMTALQRFTDDNPAPPQDCLDWIRRLLESIPNYQGVWDDPDGMKGKKKDKPKYPARAVRELVKRLNPNLR